MQGFHMFPLMSDFSKDMPISGQKPGLHRRGVVGISTSPGSPTRPVRDVCWRPPGNPPGARSLVV